MEYKVTLLSSLYKGHAATFIAFKDVQNPLELKNEILKGNIKAAVFNKNMVILNSNLIMKTYII